MNVSGTSARVHRVYDQVRPQAAGNPIEGALPRLRPSEVPPPFGGSVRVTRFRRHDQILAHWSRTIEEPTPFKNASPLPASASAPVSSMMIRLSVAVFTRKAS